MNNALVIYHYYHNFLPSFFEICFQTVASVHSYNTRLASRSTYYINIIKTNQGMLRGSKSLESPWRKNACTRVPTVYLLFRKRKIKLRFSTSNFQEKGKLKIKRSISIFIYKKNEDLNLISIFNFHRKWKLKLDANFRISILRFEQGIFIFRFEALTSGKSKKQ